MSWAQVGGAAVGVIGNSIMGGAAGDAADAQNASSQAAIAEQRRQYDQTRADNMPFMATGTAANRRLAQLLGLGGTPGGRSDIPIGSFDHPVLKKYADKYGGGDFAAVPEELRRQAYQERDAYTGADSNAADYGSLTRKFGTADMEADPVYQSGLKFGLDTGTDAINARAIATGGYDSGATLKALTRFGNDYGSTKAEGSYNRFNADNTNTYNRLAGVSGTGQTAANTITSAGMNTGNNVSNLMTGIGNSTAAGIVGGANAWGSAAGGVNNAINNYQSNRTLQALLARNGGNSSGSYSSNGGYAPTYANNGGSSWWGTDN